MEGKFLFFLIKHRPWFIVVMILILAGGILGSFQVAQSIEPDFLKSFSQNNPQVKNLNYYYQKYGKEDFLTVIIKGNKKILTPQVTEEIIKLAGSLMSTQYINYYFSFFLPFILKRNIPLPLTSPYFSQHKEEVLKQIKSLALKDLFISHDGNKALMILSLRDNTLDSCAAFLDEQKKYYQTISFDYISDKTVFKSLYLELSFSLFILPLTIILIIVAIFYFFYRSFSLTLFSLTPISLSIFFCFFLFFITGTSLNLLLIIVPAFILLLGSADSLHFILRFKSLSAKHGPTTKAIALTFSSLFKPIIITSLTTAAGFYALLSSSIESIKLLGFFTGTGILIACLFNLVFLPLLVSFYHTKTKTANFPLIKRFTQLLYRFRLPIFIGYGLLIIICVCLIIFRSDASVDFSFFKTNHPLSKMQATLSLEFFDPYPVYTEFTVTDLNTAESLLEIKRALALLKQNPRVLDAFCIFSFLFQDNDANITKAGIDRLLFSFLLVKKNFNFNMNNWINGNSIKIIYFLKSSFSFDTQRPEPADRFGPSAGITLFFLGLNKTILHSALLTIAITLILIFIILLAVFRSLTISIINIVPLLSITILTYGLINLFGFKINLLTANLGAIILGVTVDYSVHLTSYLRLHCDKPWSIASSQIGPPIFINALIIAAGMVPLLFSPIMFYFQISTIMILIMLLSAVLMLVALPVFLINFFNKHS